MSDFCLPEDSAKCGGGGGGGVMLMCSQLSTCNACTIFTPIEPRNVLCIGKKTFLTRFLTFRHTFKNLKCGPERGEIWAGTFRKGAVFWFGFLVNMATMNLTKVRAKTTATLSTRECTLLMH